MTIQPTLILSILSIFSIKKSDTPGLFTDPLQMEWGFVPDESLCTQRTAHKAYSSAFMGSHLQPCRKCLASVQVSALGPGLDLTNGPRARGRFLFWLRLCRRPPRRAREIRRKLLPQFLPDKTANRPQRLFHRFNAVLFELTENLTRKGLF